VTEEERSTREAIDAYWQLWSHPMSNNMRRKLPYETAHEDSRLSGPASSSCRRPLKEWASEFGTRGPSSEPGPCKASLPALYLRYVTSENGSNGGLEGSS
jgi:hypothetical protein